MGAMFYVEVTTVRAPKAEDWRQVATFANRHLAVEAAITRYLNPNKTEGKDNAAARIVRGKRGGKVVWQMTASAQGEA
jgi:hypothetical protein